MHENKEKGKRNMEYTKRKQYPSSPFSLLLIPFSLPQTFLSRTKMDTRSQINHIKRLLLWPDRALASCTIFLIKGYQKTISPDHSNFGKTRPFEGCKFHPTCSEYATLVLKKSGFIFGIPRIVWRILRCNPWSRGGVDAPS